jgi:hypothetical protein
MKSLGLIIVATTVLLVGCAYSITDVEVDNLEPSCVRGCSSVYSSCVSGGNQIGAKTETLRACRESFVICTNTCPPKQCLSNQ